MSRHNPNLPQHRGASSGGSRHVAKSHKNGGLPRGQKETVVNLRKLATKRQLKGRSRMNKTELQLRLR